MNKKTALFSSETETLTHTDLMAKRDGAVRLWRITDKSAKLVKDGTSFARIDACTDGAFVVTLHGVANAVQSWEAAKAWLTAQLTVAALSADIWV